MEEYHAKCTQESNISNITKTLDRMERTQERLVVALEKQIDQGARIVSLEDNHESMHENIGKLFAQVRDLELKQARSIPSTKLEINDAIGALDKKVEVVNQFIGAISGRPAKACMGVLIGLIVLGTVCDLTYHFDTVKTFYAIVKG